MSTPHLPRQLQRQAEEIAAFDKSIEDAQAPPDPNAPEPPVTPVEPVGEPKVVPLPVHEPTSEAEQWRQRYLTLEGKYRAEVPRLHEDVRGLKQQLQQVLDATKAPTPATPATPRTSKVTAKDVETFGSDLVDLMRRQAEDVTSETTGELKGELEKLRTENAELKSQLTGVTKTQEVSGQQIFLSKLAGLVPDWQTINTDPKFLDWLGGTDEMSGLTRQAYVDHAYKNLDVARTAKIFNTWKALVAATVPPASVPAQLNPEIQRQVTPGKSKSPPAAPVDPNTKTWTSKEIEMFYTEVRQGKHTREEAERIENEIDLAVSQGRVR